MRIDIPSSLRIYTNNLSCITVHADTIAQAMTALFAQYPEFRKHLYTPEGELRSYVNLYLNDNDVRYLPERENTPLRETDTLSLLPSTAGGSGRNNPPATSNR